VLLKDRAGADHKRCTGLGGQGTRLWRTVSDWLRIPPIAAFSAPASITAITLAELGDKTFFVAMLLAGPPPAGAGCSCGAFQRPGRRHS